MMFTQGKLHSLALLLLGVFIIILATKRFSTLEEILTIIGIIIGIKLIFHSLKQLDIIK
ncbi:hypothetical protein HYV10_00825 [Candidatus Dependentiae bacterium]|nr:hypothetical protein [Candidatus Dependentiae bacterium]